MERVLSTLSWQVCLVYIDDVILYNPDLPSHLASLDNVLSCLGGAGLKLKPKKCFLIRKQVHFLGHVVSSEGVATDPDKIAAVQNWAQPTSVTEVRSFLGLASYYRRFVPNFAEIARPLVQLTEKSTQFLWGEAQESAFQKLKTSLTQSPVLVYPCEGGDFILDTDASNFGIGAVLSQIQEGEEKVLAYASRALTKQERRYCVTRKELLAVVYFTQYFKHFLLGRPFTIRTDHASLKWLKSFKEPEGQLARWMEIIGGYDFHIEHRPGKEHGNADALSRGPCTQCGGSHDSDPSWPSQTLTAPKSLGQCPEK